MCLPFDFIKTRLQGQKVGAVCLSLDKYLINKQVPAFKMGGDVKKIKKAFGPKMSQAKKQKMKKKKSFPDLNKDGKVTFADVLKGRGVNKKA